MGVVDFIATITSVIYVILAIQNKAICFLFGLISALVWAYASYFQYGLVWDASLQLFYAVMSIYGWWRWSPNKDNMLLPICPMAKDQHLFSMVCIMVLTMVLGLVSNYLIATNFAWLDAFTTSILIVGTFQLAQRWLESWIYMLVADLLYIYIYGTSGAYFFAAMMAFYCFMAVWGYSIWRRSMDRAVA